MEGPEERILGRARKTHKSRDNVVMKALAMKEDGWEEMDGLVTWKGRVYIPKDQEL